MNNLTRILQFNSRHDDPTGEYKGEVHLTIVVPDEQFFGMEIVDGRASTIFGTIRDNVVSGNYTSNESSGVFLLRKENDSYKGHFIGLDNEEGTFVGTCEWYITNLMED